MNLNQPGTLYIVATPIGNLADMVPRAVTTLHNVSVIACEDTRHSKKLLSQFSIDTPCITYHDYTDQKSVDKILTRLQHSEDVALISDAGTPLISDPGYRLVAQARLRGFHVIPIPGACAATAALSVSGLPTDKFRFLGFLPAKVGQRKKALEELKAVTETLVFYEAPHLILASLNDLIDVFGQDRLAFMAREVSKTFETYLYGTISQIKTQVNNDSNQQRGEIVIIIAGNTDSTYTHSPETESLVALLLKELPITKAASLAAKITGGDKKQLYQVALSLQNK